MHKLRTPWRAVAAAFALNGLLVGVWASRIPAVVEIYGLSASGLGIMLLFMGCGAVVSFPVAGRLADSIGAAPLTRWISIGYVGAPILVALMPSTGWLAPSLFVFGMLLGSLDVVMNTWAAEVEKHMGRSVMSSFHAMWSVGAGVGAGFGYFATSWGLSVLAHFTLASILAGALLLPFIMISWTSQTRPHDPDAPAFAIPRGALVLVGFVTLASFVGEGAMADWSAVYLRDTLGSSEAQATLGYTVFSMAMVSMRLVADRVITRFGPVAVTRVSGIVATLGYVLLIAGPSVAATLPGFALIGIGYAAVVPLAFSRAAVDPNVPPGQAIASVATFGYGGMLLGPPLIGFVAELTSLRFTFVIVAALAMSIAVLARVLKRE